jgi:acyl transferase domain-containing protein
VRSNLKSSLLTYRERRYQKSRIFVISASDEAGIQRYCSELKKYLETTTSDSVDLADLAFTLSERRSHFLWRAHCISDSHSGLIKELTNGPKAIRIAREPPRLGFVFTGQGAQWSKMGDALQIYPVYRDSLKQASHYMASLGSPWKLTGDATCFPFSNS